MRARLLEDYGLEIGAGLGDLAGKVWRIGLMGYSSRPDNILLCLAALGSELNDLGLGLTRARPWRPRNGSSTPEATAWERRLAATGPRSLPRGCSNRARPVPTIPALTPK